MEFKEAYEHLTNGKKINRRGWRDSTMYLKMNDTFEVKCYRQECAYFRHDLTVLDYSWVILGEENLVSFADAIPLLLKGKKIKLETWPSDCYIEVDSDKKSLIKYGLCEFDFVPTFECFAANDWDVIDSDENNIHRELKIEDGKVTELK